MYIRSQKKGVSLVMVLIFMMVATIMDGNSLVGRDKGERRNLYAYDGSGRYENYF